MAGRSTETTLGFDRSARAAWVFAFLVSCGVGALGLLAAAQGPAAGLRPEQRTYRRDLGELHPGLRKHAAPPGESAAALRWRAFQQKMALRNLNAQRSATGAAASSSPSIPWVSLGPAPLASDATGDGMQDYNWVSGRATTVVIDPADSTANTVLLGGAYGGLWRSTNAGSLSADPSAVTWQPLIDSQPTLAVGAIALGPGNSNVILVGTGETNSSSDSYYGLGILRSSDGGSTWTQITSAGTGESFLGVGFSRIAFSTANPGVAVAGTAGDNGVDLGREEDGKATARGLYDSQDGGATWNRVTLSDGAVPSSASGVIYNANQDATGTFYAFIRRHGLYSSTDGQHFTRLATQPTAGLTSANCPANVNSSGCPIYRGELSVVPGRNEMYAWVVDVQPGSDGSAAAVDDGIWRSTDGGATWAAIADNGITNCGDSAFGAASGCGVEQGWYNLALAAIPNAGGTDLYAGAVNLYKCTLQGGTTCTQGDWINLTHVYGCDPGPLGAPAHVHPDQHGIAFQVAGGKAVGYFAHDGGISRALDGYTGLTSGSCSGTNQFDSLSETLGPMTEFVSLSAHPTNADILFGGTQDNGAPKTGAATTSTTWQNALSGDAGFTAINPANSNEWFAESPYLVILKCELGTGCNDAGFSEIVSSANLGGDQGAFYSPYILDPQNPQQMLVGACRVWRVSTSGAAPLQLSNDFETLGTGACTGSEINLVTALAAGGAKDFNGNSTVVYAGTDGYGPLTGSPGGEVWLTTNAGATLMANVTQNINPQGYAIAAVAIDSTDSTGQTAYVGIMGFSTPSYPTSHIWKTSNAGAAWTDWTGTGATALPSAPVDALLVDSAAGQIYAGTDVGVFVSSTANPRWAEVGPVSGAAGFLPSAPVTALQLFNPDAGTKTLLASTYGRGVWSFALVTSPDFTNTISNPAQTIFPGQTATYNGVLGSKNGYASRVNLSCWGSAPSTCTVQPTSLTPTGTYSMTAGGALGDYSFSAHAAGTDPNGRTHDAAVTLHVVDFGLTAPSPNALTVAQGGTSTAATLEVTAQGSFSGQVALSCPQGLPAGAGCVFSPSATVAPTATSPVTVTLTVTAGSQTPTGGPVTVTLSAASAGAPAPKTQTFGLTVTGPTPDFSISVAASPATTVAGQTVSWSGKVTAINGYGSSVTLSCSAGAPDTCRLSPSSLVPTVAGTTFTATVGNSATGNFNFSIQASDGSTSHATPTANLTVGTDVTWSSSGSTTATVTAGQSASFQFSADPLGGQAFSAAVSFSCSGLPSLSNCVFNPASIAAGSGSTPVTLTLRTTAPSGSRPADMAPPKLAGGFYFYGLLALTFVAGTGWSSHARWARGPLRAGIVSILLGISLLSCGGLSGGGGKNPGTPPGTSQIKVTANTTAGPVHDVVVTLTVQ